MLFRSRKLGPRAEEAGSVNPRVFKHVIDEGRFCEDSIAAEYFGGVLASSKTPNGRDDRGVTVMGVIKEMSVYQIRCHYVFYQLVYSFFKNTELNPGLGEECTKMEIYVPLDVLSTALALSQEENPWEIMIHCATGLYGRGLIGNYSYGGQDHLQKKFPEANRPGIILQPTLRGAELFMWANGQQGATGHEIFKVDEIKVLPEVTVIPGAMPTKKQPETA